MFAGKPLIAWSIDAAIRAQSISRVIVSTDDEEIAQISRNAGAEVPFLRPAELSGDNSPHYAVIAHALDWFKSNSVQPELLCLLQPTSPLRTSADIDRLMVSVRDTGADCGFTVSRVEAHPAHMYRLKDDGRAEPYIKETDEPERYVRSQDLEPLYLVNGAVYVLRPETFRDRSSILSPYPLASIMPPERSIDIDEEYQFTIAESVFSLRIPPST